MFVVARAFQILRAELENARKPDLFQQHLESVGVVAMVSDWVIQEYNWEWAQDVQDVHLDFHTTPEPVNG